MPHEPQYWFRAKRYGWGWGLPLKWQGWAVLLAYVLSSGMGVIWLRMAHQPLAFVLYISVITAGLLATCYFKGEPAKWRWGGE
jgi:hypothetical protein